MSINKLDNLTRRLNRAMRSILLNSDPDEVADLGKRQVIETDTWETIGRLLKTKMTLHPNYTEIIEEKNSDSDESYMAHIVYGTCICWNGEIECGASKEDRQAILNFREKGCSQDWWAS